MLRGRTPPSSEGSLSPCGAGVWGGGHSGLCRAHGRWGGGPQLHQDHQVLGQKCLCSLAGGPWMRNPPTPHPAPTFQRKTRPRHLPTPHFPKKDPQPLGEAPLPALILLAEAIPGSSYPHTFIKFYLIYGQHLSGTQQGKNPISLTKHDCPHSTDQKTEAQRGELLAQGHTARMQPGFIPFPKNHHPRPPHTLRPLPN